MSELGELLKKARLEKGISLDDLQETTKIRKKYLECIEEGNFHALPGSFYVRAFIKSYAEAVGLDPGEVQRLFRDEIPDAGADPAAETISPKRTISKRSDKWSRFATGIMLASFFLLIVGLIYYFAYNNYKGSRERSETERDTIPITDSIATDPPETQAPAGTSSPEAKAAGSPTPVKPEVKFIRNADGIEYYEVRNADKLKVEMSLTGSDCWFQIDQLTRSGESYTREMLQQGSLSRLGSPQQWETDKPVYLNIGLPTAVELKVNGVQIPLGELSNPKRLQFEPAKLQPAASE